MRVSFSQDVTEDIAAAASEDAAFALFADYTRSFGADLVSYHHLVINAVEDRRFSLMSVGFPKAWVERYRTSRYKVIDPITCYAAVRTRPFLWSEIGNHVDLTPDQQDYIDALYEWLGQGDGIALPLFGPSGHHGYAGIGWTTKQTPPEAESFCTLQAMSECFHLRICELRLSGRHKDFDLTDVQQRLLRALATGQSDELICGMVNLRPEALRSAIDRLLRTMDVTDRAGALLRARGLGLIKG